MSNTPVRLAVLGAGMRAYGLCENLLALPHRVRVVAVAEPQAERRTRMAARHGVPASGLFSGWQEFFQSSREVDAVLVATMDRDHVGPAVATLEAGYDLLLEKPMAPNLADIVRIASAYEKARARGVLAGVVHPLRYGPSFAALKSMVDQGRIGRLITLDHLEGVGWWHQAHSFVRGNWSRTEQSSFMLLAKSCHDIDYVCHLVGRPVSRVSSFGSLSWFRPENAPAGSAERCVDCPLEPDCEYSAIRWYASTDREQWPAAAISSDHSLEAHLSALHEGPYGRCVWRAGNDVVDHQVVAMEFDGGITATVTMTAFSQAVARRNRLHGTKAEIEFDQESVVIRDFAGDHVTRMEFGNLAGGHAGADLHILDGFFRAVERRDQDEITTTIPESATTHAVVFAAEHARLSGGVVDVAAFAREHGIQAVWPGERA